SGQSPAHDTGAAGRGSGREGGAHRSRVRARLCRVVGGSILAQRCAAGQRFGYQRRSVVPRALMTCFAASKASPRSVRGGEPRSQRFGAAGSAIVLVLALVVNAWPVIAGVGVLLALSAGLGTRWFLFSRPWPVLRRWLAIRPSELEHEMPPRFAQALGAAFLALGIAFLAAGLASWGSIPVLAVVALQTLLAATGFCVGCRLFFLRWWVPELFARLVGRG